MRLINGCFSDQGVRVGLRSIVALCISVLGLSLLGATNTFFLAFLPLVIAVFFIEQYYASPATVLANAFALLLLFLAEREIFINADLILVWLGCIILAIFLLVCSLVIKAFQEEESNFLYILSKIIAEIGSARFLYGLAFLVFIAVIGTIASGIIVALGIVFLLALYSKAINSIINIAAQFIVSGKSEANILGRIISLEGSTAIKVRLNEYRSPGNLIEIEDREGERRRFVLTDVLIMESQIIAEAVLIDAKPIILATHREVFSSTYTRDENIIGRVRRGSNINKVIFEPLSLDSYHLEHGDTISVQIIDQEENQRKVLYQITNAIALEEDMVLNISRRSIGIHAEQIGIYYEDERIFKSYGWTPDINALVFSEQEFSGQVNKKDTEYLLGFLPNIKLPIFLDLETAVTHHMAVIGVTGSGKSHMVRRMMSALLQNKTHVVIVDFTGEYKKKFADLSISYDDLTSTNIEAFIQGQPKIGIFELPDISNTEALIADTQKFLEIIFKECKKPESVKKRVCIVLEEAHTVIPEKDFLGVNNWDSKAVVNKIGQIALQGRKYGVGLWVIAQRTANVSKTVLTQCNTIICFQVFDNTTKDFIGNYIGDEFKGTLTQLKQYHAIVAGKSISSNRPLIIDLTEKIEETSLINEPNPIDDESNTEEVDPQDIPF